MSSPFSHGIVRLVVSPIHEGTFFWVGRCFVFPAPTRSTCDPDQRERHLADPGGVRPAQDRAGEPVGSGTYRDREEDRGCPGGRCPPGERWLPRRQGGTGQAGTPGASADAAPGA